MVTSPDQLQLLLDRRKKRFKNNQLNISENLRTRLLNLPCFGDVTEVNELIPHLHTELNNDCRTCGRVYKSVFESWTSSNVIEAVIHGVPSDPELSISQTCPVMVSNPNASETLCSNTELSSSQEDDFSLNAHKFIAVLAHIETENKSGNILNPAVPNVPHHSATEVSDECNYRDSLVLPGNISHALNDNQEPDAVLLDADYHGYPLSNSVVHKFGNKISEESNSDDHKLNSVYPHYLVSFNGFSVQYVLKQSN
ncbi:unnamed protein product [Schistosoma margrebowiei]|uniref:Uncharacterized protein n=1 Tax=Schistosoma margrebowiei TaxID=48269 RepID=A0A183LXY2_9TREM|nr:unnamed protein product [Schistosoma margrebowiei]